MLYAISFTYYLKAKIAFLSEGTLVLGSVADPDNFAWDPDPS